MKQLPFNSHDFLNVKLVSSNSKPKLPVALNNLIDFPYFLYLQEVSTFIYTRLSQSSDGFRVFI